MTGSNGSRRRHGRAPAPQSEGDAVLKRRMVRIAVLPAGVIAVAGAALVAYVMSVEGTVDALGSPAQGTDGVVLWSVLGAALLLVCGVIFGAAHSATAHARYALERQTVLRRSVARGQFEIRSLLNRLEQGERPRPRPQPALHEPGPEADAFELLTHELAHAQHAAEAAVTDAVALVRSTSSGSEEKVEVFVNLARRLQSLVHREIELLDELENEVEDPDLLKGLFHVDHLATRIRRHAENLAVLGGAVSRRQWSRPVTMTEVLRSSIAEVEQYPRVKLVPPIEGTLRGHAVADVIHLLAELVENATVFSAPQTQVLLRVQHVTAGLAIEVEDRGLGMPVAEQNRMNAVLSDPERIDVGALLQDGRIGLFVVSALAQRHGIVVQLQSNIYGGIQAVLVLPREVLGDDPGAAAQSGAAAGARSGAGARSVAGAGTNEVAGASSTPAVTAGTNSAAAVAPMPRARTESTEHPQTATPAPSEAIPAQTASEPEAPAHTLPSPSPSQQSRPQPHSHTRPDPRPQPQPQGQQPRPQPDRAQPAPASMPSPAQPGAQPHPQALPRRPVPTANAAHANAAHASTANLNAAHANTAHGNVANAQRPELPRRRRQEHLAPELREMPAAHGGEPGQTGWDKTTQGHDPGLMAAFRRGTSLAEESDGKPGGTGTDVPHPVD